MSSGKPTGDKALSQNRLSGGRLSQTERVRVFDYVRDRRKEGYSTKAIALATGLAQSSVADYLRKLGMGGKISYKRSDSMPLLEPFDWRDKRLARYQDGSTETINPPLAYTVSTTVSLLNSTMQTLRCESGSVRFANDVADALGAGDEEWMRHAATVINDAASYLAELTRVLHDSGHRRRVIHDPSFRGEFDQPPRSLRAVH
jgi:hypothetical protein